MLRLGSAALPIGAFAYSQGLEQAVARGLVRDADTAEHWIGALLEDAVLTGDVPVLVRLRDAWCASDLAQVQRWNDLLYATRSTRELREEERQLGSALFRLLARLGEPRARPFERSPRATLACAFALASHRWSIPAQAAALSYAFAWAEAQVGAATRLVPLGQTAAQVVLSGLISRLDTSVCAALAASDAELAWTAPGQALLSADHETQYSRLFRS